MSGGSLVGHDNMAMREIAIWRSLVVGGRRNVSLAAGVKITVRAIVCRSDAVRQNSLQNKIRIDVGYGIEIVKGADGQDQSKS